MIANITAPLAIGLASDYYSIKSAEGFASASLNLTQFPRPGFHGIKIPRAYWRGRIMRLLIGIRAATSSIYEEKRRDLLEAFDFPRNGLTWLEFSTVGGLDLQVKVQLNAQIQSALIAGYVTIGEARIELIAEDPIFYSQTEHTQDITFVDGSGTVNNAGNAPVFSDFRIHGNVEDPSVENTDLGMTVSFTGITVAAGDYLDIDTGEEIVNNSILESKYSYLDEDDFFYLQKGDNTITLDGTTGGSGYRKVTFTYRDGYIGI